MCFFYIFQKKNLNKKEIINYFFDYLHMCDLMQINIDLYPQNIKEAHDNIVKIFKAQQDKEKDKIMENISKKYTKIIPPQFENKQNNYIIYIPKNLKELADEGEQQHNCVGSYYDKIIKGESIIFFIRNKNTPLESLITCEYSQEQLYQIKAKNNKTVNDDEILAFANKFCNILKTYK